MLLIAIFFYIALSPFKKTPKTKNINPKKIGGTTTYLFVVSHYINNPWGRIIRWWLGHETGYESLICCKVGMTQRRSP